jgi:polysaccharide chain length determinant protein (PEP-CTERM system associated)
LPEQQDVSLDESVQKLLQVAIRRRWWVLIPASVIALGACLASLLLPDRYESKATILVERQEVSERYITPNTTVDVREALLSMAEAILSQTQLLRIIDEFNLYPEEKKGLAPEQVAELMRSHIKIEPLRKIGEPQNLNIFTISFAGVNPHEAHEVTTKLTNLFIEESDKSRGEQSKGTTNFLSGELQTAANDLKQQESRVREFKMQYLGELPQQEQGNLAILTGLHSELQNTMANLARARQQQAYLESLLSQYENMPAGQLAASGTGAPSLQDTIRAELTRLRKEKTDLLAQYTEKYPDVVKVDQQISQTEALLAASTQAPKPTKEGTVPENSKSVRPVESNTTIAQVKSQLEANRLEIQNASEDAKQKEAQIADYQRRLNLTPVREAQMAELLRGYDQAKQYYDDLSSKKTQSELATGLEIRQQAQRFNIIDPPSLPTIPSNSQRVKISLAGLGLGIAVGVALAFLVDATDHSLRDEQELSTTFSFPLLLGVPMLLSKVDERRRSRRAVLEWLLGTTLCLLICATEFYFCGRG